MVEDTQKRYADDVTLQELVRLRVESERLREALAECEKPFSGGADTYQSAAHLLMNELERRIKIARSALQQKENE